MSLFNLSGLPSEKVKVDFSTDGHNKIQKTDKSVFDDNFKFVKDKAKLETPHFANVSKGSEEYKKVQRIIASTNY
jgi:hypothetical protein